MPKGFPSRAGDIAGNDRKREWGFPAPRGYLRGLFWFSLLLTWGVFFPLIIISPLAAKNDDPYQKLFDELKIFTDVLSLVERDYVSEVQSEELVQGAIKGMLAALDPHSGYLEPEFYQDLRVQTKGEFGGLGIEITIRDGLLVVVAPMEGSPAEKAGIRAGDKIVKIEGKFTKEFSLVDAVKRLRGPRGTPIEISVLREGQEELLDVTIIREIIAVKSVRHRMLEPGVGYARVSQFVESTGDDLKGALRSIHKESERVGGIKGLILDLRNNPGGLLTQAVQVSDLFLNEGIIVYTDGRVEAQRQKFFAQERGTEPNYPILVLVNEGSASASEIVSGALQDHGRALVLGTETFGKGSVQTITPLSNGGALTLTTALYYTKSGRSIQQTGIVPDIIVEQALPEDTEAPAKKEKSKNRSSLRIREGDLPGAIQNPSGKRDDPKQRQKRGEQQKIGDIRSDGAEIKRPEDMTLQELLAVDLQLKRALEVLKEYEKYQPGLKAAA